MSENARNINVNECQLEKIEEKHEKNIKKINEDNEEKNEVLLVQKNIKMHIAALRNVKKMKKTEKK